MRLCASTLLVLLAACGGEAAAPGGQRPNVLILITDDLTSAATGTWGRGGGLIETPGIDQLAARGLRFTRALAPAPFCTPSRQALLTGRWPHSIRVTQLFSRLDPSLPTLGTVFRGAGYDTAAIGKMHWYRAKWKPGTDFGFDTIIDKPEWRAGLSGEERELYERWNQGWSREERAGWSMSNPDRRPLEIEEGRQMTPFFIDQALAWMEKRSRPFLCILSLYEPHAPFPFPPRLAGAVDPASLVLPSWDPGEAAREVPALATVFAGRNRLRGPLTESILRDVVAAYLTSVLWLDSCIADLDRRLQASGRYDDTIVVFWSDNGYFLGEHGLFSKNYPFREVAEVPLAILAPGVRPGVSKALVNSIDLFPTLCDLVGIERPAFLEGESRADLLRGEGRGAALALCEFTGLAASAQDERYKLVLGKEAGDGWDQLYDLEQDPGERENLFGHPELTPVVERLTRAMAEVWRATPGDGLDPWMPQADDLEALRWALRQVDNDRKPPAPQARGEGD